MIQWEIKTPQRTMKSLLIGFFFFKPQTQCKSLSIIVALEWFVLRLVIMETQDRG